MLWQCGAGMWNVTLVPFAVSKSWTPAYAVKGMPINKQMENNRIASWFGVNAIIPSITAACPSGSSKTSVVHCVKRSGLCSVWANKSTETIWAKLTSLFPNRNNHMWSNRHVFHKCQECGGRYQFV